jgi:hypothetical protein
VIDHLSHITGYTFNCPQCGHTIQDGPFGWRYDSDLERVPEYEPLWEGGPLIQVPGLRFAAKHRAVNQRITTPCGCVFPIKLWTMNIFTRSRSTVADVEFLPENARD